MSFGDIEFLAFFLPAIWLVHWILPRRATWQNGWLLLVSYVLYASWNPRLLLLFLVSTGIDFAIVRGLDRLRPTETHGRDEAELRRLRMRRLLFAGIAYNLGQLCVFKYLGFFASSLNTLLESLGVPSNLAVLQFVLPLGISFWTLQKIAYQLDVYHGRERATESLLQYALFVAFFPQLASGPIVRGSQLIPQLAEKRDLTLRMLREGGAAFLRGFAAKYLISAVVASLVVDPVFARPEMFTVASRWAAVAGYALQVFCDFAGYTEMAIGTAMLFGLTLPRNFNYPFLAQSMMDFWRRWHITLTGWLFDYIYSPLITGTGWFRGRLDLGLLVVFLACGLWHGAAWSFVLWGAVHGLGLIVHRRWDQFYRGLCRRDRAWVERRKSGGYAAVAWLVTQAFFVVSLVPFRAGNLDSVGRFAVGLTCGGGPERTDLGGISDQLNLAVSLGLLLAYYLLEIGRGPRIRSWMLALPGPARGVAYGLVIVYLLVLMPLTGAAFIYAQF